MMEREPVKEREHKEEARRLSGRELTAVREEVDAALMTVRIALVTSGELADLRKRLPICSEQLQQVRGVMEMLQLPGAVMILDEMLQLIRALEQGRAALPRSAVDSMIHALLQLPAYLDQLERGGHRSPFIVQPLIDELRTAHGASPLTHEVLFSPELEFGGPDALLPGQHEGRLHPLARRLRPLFEQTLLSWMRQPGVADHVEEMRILFDALAQHSSRPAVEQLFRMAEAVFLLLEDERLQAGKSLYRLMGRVNQQLKRLIDEGESDLQRDPPLELMRRLLYHIARSGGGGERVTRLRERYRLDNSLPGTQRIDQARAELRGPDHTAVQSALAALRGEIRGLKKALDEWSRGDEPPAEGGQRVVDELQQFATTLEFLGLEIAASTVRNQVERLRGIIAAGEPPEESRLLEMASSLVMVESVLRGGMEETALTESTSRGTALLMEGERRRLRSTVCSEIISELNRVKVVLEDGAFNINQGELIFSLKMIRGALQMMELQEAARLIGICHRFVSAAARLGHRLQQEQMESVAALISGVEFCAEATAEGQYDAEQLLGDARQGALRLQEDAALMEQQQAEGDAPGEEWLATSIIKSSAAPRGGQVEHGAIEPDSVEEPAAGDDVPDAPSDHGAPESSGMDGQPDASGLDVQSAAPGTERDPPAGDGPESGTVALPLLPYLPQQDAQLLEIFSREIREHLDLIRRSVAALESGTASAQDREALQRALHTMRGSALAAEVSQLGELAELLERLASGSGPLPAELLRLLRASCSAIEESLPSLPAEGALRKLDPLLQQAATMLDEARRPPQQEGEPQSGEADLLTVFCDEAEEILQRFLQQLGQWRDGQAEGDDPVQALERELHTLKGSARAVEIEPMADISHVLESLLGEVAAQRIEASGELFALLESAHWQLLGMLERLRSGERVPDQPKLIRQIREFVAAARGVEPDRPEPEGELFPAAEESRREEGGRVVHFPLSGKEAGQRGQELPAQESGPPAERFRVRADMLDGLASMAAEAGICRSRISQLIDGVRTNIEELHSTVERLRSQLRRLDMEEESGVPAGRGEESDTGEERFDPLELERFSHRQTLARGIMESLNDLVSLEGLMREQIRHSSTLLEQQGRATHQLQDVLGRARLQAFSTHLPRLYRLVEQVCRELDKQVELQVDGAGQELDRTMLARLLPAIEHILRNAIVHGIERPAQRAACGKPETGRITIQLERHGADMLIRIDDDGAGLDLERIRQRGIEAGYLHPSTPFSEEQAVQFIQRAGFSTAAGVTRLAGRGVGLDVVSREIRQLGGTLQIRNRPGEGLRYTLRLPLMRYLSSALLVVAGGETYALPPMCIEGITRIEGRRINARGREMGLESYVECMGQSYRIEVLAELVGAGHSLRFRDGGHYVTVLARVAERRLAVVVERVIGEREILMKSFGPQLARLRGVPGITFLDDGSAVMILDLAALVEPGGISYRQPARRPVPGARKRPRILVVDDSITVRNLLQRLLQRHGMEVLSARDGMEAVALLDKERPDMVLLDVEMPRMNGYELARHIRNSSAVKGVPIIMISSRSGARHRQKALAVGVEHYLGKPYREEELLEQIRRLQLENHISLEG